MYTVKLPFCSLNFSEIIHLLPELFKTLILITASACYGNQDNGKMVAGVSDALWKNGRACGSRYRVPCIGGANKTPNPCKLGNTVVVKIVDYCKTGCQGIINLSRDAFSTIANTDAGIVEVEFFEYVSDETLFKTIKRIKFSY